MDNSTYVSLSLATAMRNALDVTANNIANANTAGFKDSLAAATEAASTSRCRATAGSATKPATGAPPMAATGASHSTPTARW